MEDNKKTKAVANPPAGGDQTQASTNDDNQNTLLQERPYLVTVAARGQTGVAARFSDQSGADRDAAARKAGPLPDSTKVLVKKEADLPDYVAEVEAAEFG